VTLPSRRILVALAAAAALALGAAVAAGGLWVRWALSPAAETSPEILFEVERGATLGGIARRLEDAGIVRSERALRWLARWDDVANDVKAGEYWVSADLAPGEILGKLVRGEVATWEVVIPEGLTAEEIAPRLAAQGLVDPEAFLAVVNDPASAKALGVEGESLEGYLFPETYRLPRGLPAREVAGVLVDHFLAVWEEIAPAAEEQGLSMHAVVTLASIVEKETGAAEERPLIASVFHNRLDRGMRLESDPTTIYGIDDFDGNLRRVHLEDGDNPYNTYKIGGLPPGPIANPGREALRAVVDPAESDYLYFVSRGDGTHVFSRTFSEHVANVDRYQRRGRRRR